MLDGICDDAPMNLYDAPMNLDDHNEPVDDEGRTYPGATGPGALIDRGRMCRNIHSEGLDCDHYRPGRGWYKFVERVA